MTAFWGMGSGEPVKTNTSCTVHLDAFLVIKLQEEKTKANAAEVLDLEAYRMFDVVSHETLIMEFIHIH